MNIFVTSYNTRQCALEHCLVHRNKMIVEYAQLLSSYHHVRGTWKEGMYKPTHLKHPSTLWVARHEYNYSWLFSLWDWLNTFYCDYTGKKHKSYQLYNLLLPSKCWEGLTRAKFNSDMLAMPDEYKVDYSVALSYRNYLNAKFKEWQARDRPIAVQFHDKPPEWLQLGEIK